jgi:hypothetical protein
MPFERKSGLLENTEDDAVRKFTEYIPPRLDSTFPFDLQYRKSQAEAFVKEKWRCSVQSPRRLCKTRCRRLMDTASTE